MRVGVTFHTLNFRGQPLRRGQVAVETIFVFSFLLFITFAIVNFAIKFHTHNIATYAAFMASRSFQVFGDQTSAESFKETRGAGSGKLIEELEKDQIFAITRVAEDIFTCALPWVPVPEGDGKLFLSPAEVLRNPITRCQEGKRKYKKTNFGKNFAFIPFKNGLAANLGSKLNEATGSFTEGRYVASKFGSPTYKHRDYLRYGIAEFQYRMPVLFNFGGFDEDDDSNGMMFEEVHVPILLNPGLSLTLKKSDSKKRLDEEKK